MAEFYDGPHATPAPAAEGPIYLGIKNMTEDGHLDLSEIRHIAESEFLIWTRRVEPRTGDLIFTYEASLHRYAIIPKDFRGTLGRRVALIRPRADIVDTRFLLYLFISPQWRDTVQQRVNVGSTVDRLPLTEFPAFPLRVPPLTTQHKIAAILSAYDDLIENNNRRIKLLEEMAQRIYREWFVDFRYPGHESVALVDSELGPLPEGWEVQPFAALGEYMNGYAFKPDDWGSDGLPIIKIRELKNGVTDETPRYSGDLGPKYEIADGDLLFSWSADLDAYLWTGGPAWLNQHLFRVDPSHGLRQAFLFHALRERMVDFRSRAQGTTMRHIKRAALSQVSCVVPPEVQRNRFEEVVAPVDRLALSVVRATRNLRAARDLLLPRLISGEIDVTDLGIAMGVAAA